MCQGIVNDDFVGLALPLQAAAVFPYYQQGQQCTFNGGRTTGLSNPSFQLTPAEVDSAEVIVKYSNEPHESGDYGFH